MGLNQYRVSLNTLPQVGAYISYMLSLSQIKSTRILSSSLIRSSANRYPDDTCFITTIFSLAPYELYDNQLQCVWFSHGTPTICIVALLSPYSFMRHSGGKPISIKNLWSSLALMTYLPSSCNPSLRSIKRPHCILFSITQGFFQERYNILWSTFYQKDTLLSLHLRSLLLLCVYVHPVPGICT